MKKGIQSILQHILGFERYLKLFSIFKIKTLRYDKKERDFFVFLNQIKPKSTVLDIGANVGIMTYFLAQQNKVFCFEPIPENFNTLSEIVRILKLKQVALLKYAISDIAEELTMIMPTEKNVRMQGLSHVINDLHSTQEGARVYTTKALPLDQVTEIAGQKIDAIKIDVENHEYKVLIGAKNLIKTNKPLIYIELWDNENRKNCFAFAKEMQYSIYVANGERLELFDTSKHSTQNFFFVPKS